VHCHTTYIWIVANTLSPKWTPNCVSLFVKLKSTSKEEKLPDIEAIQKNMMIPLKDNLKEGEQNISHSSRKMNGCWRG
jgi:hypothetical protein